MRRVFCVRRAHVAASDAPPIHLSAPPSPPDIAMAGAVHFTREAVLLHRAVGARFHPPLWLRGPHGARRAHAFGAGGVVCRLRGVDDSDPVPLEVIMDPDRDNPTPSGSRLLLALIDNTEAAERTLRAVMESDYPMDRVSLLGRASSSGDDPIGVYYSSVGERMRGWGGLGALWGGLWGLLSGAAGVFLLPGVGPVLAGGPLVEALAGAAAGAGGGAAAMAGAGGLSHVAVGVHRMGVPEEALERVHEKVEAGGYVMLLIVADDEVEGWRDFLAGQPVDHLEAHTYVRWRDLLRGDPPTEE